MAGFTDRYERVRRIHAGPYFETFQANDKAFDRFVFVKAARATDEFTAAEPMAAAIVEAHARNWRALARKRLEGMPAILDLDREQGRWFLVTEWVDGIALRELFNGGSGGIADPDEFLHTLLSRCLFIIGGLHAHGLIHADISPANILVETSPSRLTVNLVDPAPLLDLPDPRDATRRLILGTSAFLAPEVLAGRRATFRADLFAVGKVIEGTAARLNIAPPAVVQRLTAVRPDERPASAEQALAQLWSGGRAANAARPPPSFAQEPPPEPPHPTDWQAPTLVHAVPPPDAGPAAEAVAPAPPDFAPASIVMSVPVPPKQTADRADFSVVAPRLIQAGRNFVVEVWVAPSGQREDMLAQATGSGRMIERGGRSSIDLERDTLISVVLKLPDFELADPVEALGWNGSIRNVGFIVKAPASLAPGIYPGVAKLLQNQIPFASIMFDLEVASADARIEAPARPLDAHVQRIAHAFASYASADRAEVLRRVQGIQAVGTNVFLDIVNLRSGKDWESTLYREIESSDGFFLFWSRNAAKSEWVEREWRYALRLRGLEFINPLPLEDPRGVAPPAELRSKHFNDMLLAFIKAEEAYQAAAAKA